MRINKFSAETPLNFNRQIKKEDKKSATNPIQINQTASPVSPDFYAAYNKVSFKGKPYDGTNFRSELEKRAETSSTTLKIYPELKKVTDSEKEVIKKERLEIKIINGNGRKQEKIKS